jgi:DNA phosphorothioation-associated DGQHR protein 1
MKLIEKELNLSAMEISQPLADFYVFTIKAIDLLNICIPVRLEDSEELETYGDVEVPFSKITTGTQRKENVKQVGQIRDYIISGDAAFPNTIILGANLNEEGFRISKEDKCRWSFDKGQLNIAKNSFKASIIDGQHRVLGFKKLKEDDPTNEFLQMDIVCSLYLDLPLTYHAQIFTHINSTPRRVNRNLIYQLYQIDMDEKKPGCWSPEVLAVYMARALDNDKNSPFENRLRLSVKEKKLKFGWCYTFASIVEGILPLISTSPVRDKNRLASETKKCSNDDELVYSVRSVLKDIEDGAAFRQLYLEQKDSSIYNNILKFVVIINQILIEPKDSVFRKSIGISACFMALKEALIISGASFEEVIQAFENNLTRFDLQNLSDIPSTKLQGIIKNTMIQLVGNELNINLKNIKLNIKDVAVYKTLIKAI